MMLRRHFRYNVSVISLAWTFALLPPHAPLRVYRVTSLVGVQHAFRLCSFIGIFPSIVYMLH